MEVTTLIISQRGDIHADALVWALHKLGRRAARWMPSTLAETPVSAWISPDSNANVQLDGPDGPFETRSMRSIWLRRFRLPVMPATMSASDQVVAEREVEGFLRGVTTMIAPPALWANPPTAQRTAALKAPQLVAARAVGLAIPNTLLSNDMEHVRAFVQAASGQVIYKPFYPAVWVSAPEVHSALTAFVNAEQLDDPEALRLCPGIFQEFVPKAFELRVTILGRTCIAVRISNHEELDWRVLKDAVKLAPYRLPAAIEIRLFALMDTLGLVMGSVDMIVTPDGEYVFLEINEQGQFLWVEQLRPDISLLEPLAHFFCSADPQFRWSGTAKPKIRFNDYLDCGAFDQFEEHVRLVKPEPNRYVLNDVA